MSARDTEKTPDFQKQTPKKLGNPNWHKGKSGNPGGRPKGTVSIVTILRQQLAKHPEWAQALVKKWIQHAAEGSYQHLQAIVDRVDGKVPDRVEGADGGPIKIRLDVVVPGEEKA